MDEMARTGATVLQCTVDRWAPKRTARVRIAGDTMAIYDRGEGTAEVDNAWLDVVLDEYMVTHLPAPQYVALGAMEGFRCWVVQLAPRS